MHTLNVEAEAIRALSRTLSGEPLRSAFEAAADLIVQSSGRVVVTGMGKSGLVGRKVAATFASTGTPAFYLHPAEAGHGDLGMVTRSDIVLALSWSGETKELSDVVTYCRRFRIPLIAITSRPASALARSADIALLLPRVQEACPHDLAPTSSTTLQVVIGDALAVALIELRGFSPEEFGIFHPKGGLGARLVRVRDLMSRDDAIPKVLRSATISEATIEMSRKRLGVTAIVDDDGWLVGAFTDGDLRRSLATAERDEPVGAYMTLAPLTVASTALASEALALMSERNITQIFALEEQRLVGILHLHDALRAGIG